MKKSSFRSYAFLAAACLMSASAFATGSGQTVTSNLSNGGSIANTVRTNASVVGAGSSYSAATGEAYSTNRATATTQKNPVCECGAVSGAVGVTGEATSGASGSAFNVSTGNGVGAASSVGSAFSNVDAAAGYKGPGQNVNVYGNIAQHANMSVIADKNTGGVASAGNTGDFAVNGTVGSSSCGGGSGNCGGSTTNTAVWGSVTDVKNSTSFANTGGMIVDNVALPQAPVVSNSGSVVNAGGSYYDPIEVK